MQEVRELFEVYFEEMQDKLDEHADMLYAHDEVAQHWKAVGGKEICRQEKGFFGWLLEIVKRTEVKTEQKGNQL